MSNTPERVASYCSTDSKALMKVDDGHLIDELEVRLRQYATLPAAALYENIQGVIDRYKLHLEEY